MKQLWLFILISSILFLSGCVVTQAPQSSPALVQNPQMSELEKLDVAEAEEYKFDLNKRILTERTLWEKLDEDYIEDAHRLNNTMLDYRGRPVNAAMREEKVYSRTRVYNVQLYAIELKKIDEQKIVLEALYINQLKYNKSKAYRTVEVLQKYRAKYNETELLKLREEGKEFDLPAQAAVGGDRVDNTGMDRLLVRYGRGPELANSTSIKNIADLNILTEDYYSLALQ